MMRLLLLGGSKPALPDDRRVSHQLINLLLKGLRLQCRLLQKWAGRLLVSIRRHILKAFIFAVGCLSSHIPRQRGENLQP